MNTMKNQDFLVVYPYRLVIKVKIESQIFVSVNVPDIFQKVFVISALGCGWVGVCEPSNRLWFVSYHE